MLTTLLTVRLLKSRVRKQRSRKHGINLSSRPLFTVCFTSSPAQPERVAFYGLCFFCLQWCGFHFSPSSWLRSTTATRSRQKSVWNTTPCRLFQRWLSATSTCSKGLWLERQCMKKFCPKFMHLLIKKMGLYDVNDSIDLNKYHDLNITQFYIDAGHQSSDTVGHCIWDGKPTCDHRNFTSVLTSMGLCHTFNSGKF